jgi:hypothetical protein
VRDGNVELNEGRVAFPKRVREVAGETTGAGKAGGREGRGAGSWTRRSSSVGRRRRGARKGILGAFWCQCGVHAARGAPGGPVWRRRRREEASSQGDEGVVVGGEDEGSKLGSRAPASALMLHTL